jgi:UPF0755 protein
MRSTLRISGWIAKTVLWIFIGLLFYLSAPLEGEKNIYLEDNSTADIIAQLRQKDYDVSIVDKWVLHQLGTPIPGWIYLGKNRLHRIDFFARLVSPRTHFRSVTLIPGETTHFFLRQLAETMDYNLTRLQQAYTELSPFPEAGILADTYRIPLHLHEKGAIRFLTSLSRKRYKKMAQETWGTWDPKRWQRILTIASIIQKEAANTAEMPRVSSVIYNRLAKKMRLQMDGTLNYGRYSHTRVTPERIRTDKTTFNTYRHRGLPASPVCNVSTAAIRAALHPEKSPYLYFMKNDRGTHDFTTTYKGHLKKVHQRQNTTKEK